MWSAAQTGRSIASSIGTSDRRKKQCLENTADEVELPWVFLNRFWPAQHVVEHYHAGEYFLLFVMPGVVVGAFFLECSDQSHQLCSVESPSNGLVRFEQLIIHNTKLIPSNTQHEFFSMNIWLSMLKHGQVPTISSSLGYRSGSIFHHQWLYDAKNPFVYAWQAAFHMWKIGSQRFSASVHMESNSLTFESFPMISNDMKLFIELLLM